MARVATIAFTRYDSDPRVRRMAEALAARGDDVTAIVLAEPGQAVVRTVQGVRVIGVRIGQYRGASTLRYLVQYLRFVLAASFRLTRFHLQNRFQVVHANNLPDLVVLAALPAKLTGASVILDIHDPMPELFMSKFGAGPTHPVVRLVTLAERFSIWLADRVISVHAVQLETLLSRGYPEAKFVVIQNVPDDRIFPRGAALEASEGDTITVIYHGLISHRLGIDIAVEAMKLVAPRESRARLVLIGDGDASPAVRSMIDDLELGGTVEFRRGFIPVDQLLAHLVTADIGVVPARVDQFTRNMLPTKLIEYVTLGIPVISTNLPTVQRYFTSDQVRMVPGGDVTALADAIVELAANPTERKRQALAAMRFVDEINWDGERARYYALIDTLVAPS